MASTLPFMPADDERLDIPTLETWLWDAACVIRGMRQCLMQVFDDIYILDLHGNSKKKESSPDQNVFDITQGVSIALFVKHKGSPARDNAS